MSEPTMHEKLKEMLMQGVNRELLLEMARELTGQKESPRNRKPSVPIPPVTKYTKVKCNYTCLLCGSKWSKEVSLAPSESAPRLGLNNHVQIITAETAKEVECVAHVCQDCNRFVAGMDRAELERRYLNAVMQNGCKRGCSL